MSAVTSSRDGLTLAAHRGEGAVLLAFEVNEGLHEDLAGFAIRYQSPGGMSNPSTTDPHSPIP